MLYRIHPGGKRRVPDHGRRLYLYQRLWDRRFHERTRIFKRPAFRMRPRCRSAEKERHLHSLCRGTEAGISCRSEVSDPQGLQNRRQIRLRNQPYVPAAHADAAPPEFRECARHPGVSENGFVLYCTDQCPFTYYWVPRVSEAAKEHGIPLKVIHVTDKETAQNVPAPVTTYALFRDGKFLTQSIQSDKKFLALAGITN